MRYANAMTLLCALCATSCATAPSAPTAGDGQTCVRDLPDLEPPTDARGLLSIGTMRSFLSGSLPSPPPSSASGTPVTPPTPAPRGD